MLDLIIKNGKCYIDRKLKDVDISVKDGKIHSIGKIMRCSRWKPQETILRPVRIYIPQTRGTLSKTYCSKGIIIESFPKSLLKTLGKPPTWFPSENLVEQKSRVFIFKILLYAYMKYLRNILD